MSALSKGPYVCVMLCSKREDRKTNKINLGWWGCWVLDMKALDALSPPWLRKGPEAGVLEWRGVVGEFGSRCRLIGQEAIESGRVELQMEMDFNRGVGLMVICSNFNASVSDETIEKEEDALADAVFGEFYKLAKKSRSKTHPVMRHWAAPAGAGRWPLRLLNFQSSESSDLWAEQFSAAIEASNIEGALSKKTALTSEFKAPRGL